MAAQQETSSNPLPRSRLRWVILALLFASTVLNYVDRQTLSILAPQVQRDLGMSDLDYARVVQYFLIAYTLAFLGAGWLTDRLGTKVTLALFVGWWSLANVATGFVRNVAQLGIARTALGLGEAGNFTAAPKAVSEHFPPQERAFALGTYTAGAMVGATIAPPLVAWLALTYGWRAAFIATGAAGFVWLVAWLTIYPSAPKAEARQPREPTPWRAIVRERPVWGFALARMIADPAWYFYLFWFPKYLIDERGMTLVGIASLVWLVYLAADFGSVGGGLFSDRLIRRRGFAPANARLTGMAIAAALAPLGMLIATGVGVGPTLAFAAVVAFAHMVLQVNLGTLIVDIYPQRVVATVFGLIAAGSGLGGIFSTQLVGQLVTANSYETLFLLMGVLHPTAWLIVWLSLRSQPTSRLRNPS